MALSHPLSFQLYSARNFPPFDDVLALLAAEGFTNVETFGANHDDTAGFRQLLDRHGLSAKSGHFALDLAEENPGRIVEICRALDMETVVIPYLPAEQRPSDRAGWQALGERLVKVKTTFGQEGLRTAWHNHDFEFIALPDGSYPIEHLLGTALSWEADIAWVVRAGTDPAAWLKRYAGRVVAAHVKDIAPVGEKTDEDGWADVGSGVVDWDTLWPLAVEAGASLMIAEHDKPSDAVRFARVSAAKMKALAGLAG
ncbi:sugar phosphate isomerase/epimerase family protein [Consotaella aegiceratis]|uniref:sugar phosphate isomerase/epimerase family protein n=1 Tax=Consotaella aegiceratis TaxID=3097961 RepID=UPI002F3F4091